jgi:single-strand DNA-binding protein
MTDTVAVRGVVATEPRHLVTEAGLPITSFRLVTRRRRYDREKRVWEDADGNWYTVSAFRRLALGAAGALAKGDRVIVAGRLCIREWEGEQRGATAEIEAEGIGHDLAWRRDPSPGPAPSGAPAGSP